MENVFTVIKNAVICLLKELDPSADVFTEEIKKTEEEEKELKEYYFFTLIPTSNETVGKSYTDRSIFIDIAYYHESESNAVYLKKMEELDYIFRPVLQFGSRAATIKNVEMKIVDSILYYTFTLAFRDSREEKNEFVPMNELITKIKGV